MDGPAWTEVNAMPAAAPRPESPDDALDAALAALTATDIPPDEQDYAWADAADGRSAELAGLSDADLAELLAEPPRPAAAGWPLSYQTPQVPGGWPWPAGFAPRDGSGAAPGSPTAARWTPWTRRSRWPGSPTTATTGPGGWMMTAWWGCCGGGGG